jgi:hypothetical protein
MYILKYLFAYIMIKFNEIYHINWKDHFEESGACYAVRSIVHIRNILKSIYYATFILS